MGERRSEDSGNDQDLLVAAIAEPAEHDVSDVCAHGPHRAVGHQEFSFTGMPGSDRWNHCVIARAPGEAPQREIEIRPHVFIVECERRSFSAKVPLIGTKGEGSRGRPRPS